MAGSDVILRANQDTDGLDFATLRKDAIELVQQLSGKIWTDYNLHDPGVTILEQLCFGLTELAYQAGMSVPEYLSDQHGVIDYRRFSLFKPHEIFPNTAVTPEDYCKLLVDAIPEIDAVHIDADKQVQGVYNLRLKILESLTAPEQSAEQKAERNRQIIARVRQVYLQNRNLGEDLADIQVEDAKPCYLKGMIETSGRRARGEILADIYFQCARKISSDIRIQRYEDIYSENPDLADIFTGPLTQHGYIYSQNTVGIFKPVQELTGVIAAIEGVKKVYELELVDENGEPLQGDMERDHGFNLRLPETEQQLELLTLSYNPGKAADSSQLLQTHPEKAKKLLQDARRYLRRLEFEYNAFRSNKNNAASFYPIPQGKAHAELDYYSVQHHFPNVYGINAAGVPSSESQERKIQAKQLKAYLYPFEQLLANFQQQIQELQFLFTLDNQNLRTYFTQYLDNQKIPHIEGLYRNNSPEKVDQIQYQYDNYTSRKNRALNTLLAIYGEVFPDEALAHFSDYRQDDCDYWMIDNKIQYLKYLNRLTAERAKAFNLLVPHWEGDNLSCFQQKLGILLGFKNTRARSLAKVLGDYKVKLVADEAITGKMPKGQLETSPLPALKEPQLSALNSWEYTPGKTLTLTNAMLRDGVYTTNYRLHEHAGTTDVYLLQNHKPVLLKSCKTDNEALNYAHKFKKIISGINAGCEGFHLIEHVLLRPRLRSEAEADPALQDNFFNFTLSLVFPAWTARFSNPNFRQFVCSLINEHLPAHLLPKIYWLEFSDMEAFENIYAGWLGLLHDIQQDNQKADLNQLNAAASKLVDWLKQHAAAADYWV